MRKDTAILPINFHSSFQSFPKDMKTILEKLFTNSNPYSDDLKRLLIINTKDCLDRTNQEYNAEIAKYNLGELRNDGYVRDQVKLEFGEHEQVKAYVIITFDNFLPNANNPEFRDCNVNFDVLCDTDYWDLENFNIRPLAILGIIDGILNNARLSGIGTLNFMGANQLTLSAEIGGYSISYRAIHGSEDRIPDEEED